MDLRSREVEMPGDEKMPEEEMLGAGMMTQADLDALIAAAQSETPDSASGGSLSEENVGGDYERPRTTSAGLVDFPEFDPPAPMPEAFSSSSISGAAHSSGLNRVRDIPLEVTVELGRTRLLIRDILDLSPGSIIELDKLAGEPVDLFANGMLVARGEVIVIDDNFGVRVTEIITASERTNSEKDLHALAA